MQYFGGKQRIARRIVEAMTPDILALGVYVEPFVGGASVMSAQPHGVRIASDANMALVSMWYALSQGWVPPSEVSEETYRRYSLSRDDCDPMTAFVGFGCSFAGKWFGGYARNGRGDNYAAAAASSLRRKMLGLRGVQWSCGDYESVQIPTGSVVYCDPPYRGTTQYGATGEFDSDRFWSWARRASLAGNKVFVSEYSAPAGFEVVLEVATSTEVRTRNGRDARVERLFSM